MKQSSLSIALVAIGGYGQRYVSGLLDRVDQDSIRLVAGIDPKPERCARLADLKARGVPIYASMERWYDHGGRADLVVISSPIQMHGPQTCLALSRGSHVLCEKPMCATLEEARQMRQSRDEAERLVAIGYQWAYTEAVHSLKRDIMAGVLGRPRRLRAMVLWPRDEKYYKRNSWAGVIHDAKGNWVLDSPVNNATAHYLHNMLYVLGDRMESSAWPETVTAELYRANAIQNYDTAALRCVTRDCVEVIFIASHAVTHNNGPVFEYEFERATVSYGLDGSQEFIARFADGTRKTHGSPLSIASQKLWDTLDVIRCGGSVVCGIEAAGAHTACVAAAQRSPERIEPFPASLVHVDGELGTRQTWVAGLDQVLEKCYEKGKLPSELGAPWAKAGRVVACEGL